MIGIDRFGESAPDRDLWTYFGFTPERVARTVRAVLGPQDRKPSITGRLRSARSRSPQSPGGWERERAASARAESVGWRAEGLGGN